LEDINTVIHQFKPVLPARQQITTISTDIISALEILKAMPQKHCNISRRNRCQLPINTRKHTSSSIHTYSCTTVFMAIIQVNLC